MNIFQYKWNPAVQKLFFPVGGIESWSIRFNKCNDYVKEMRERRVLGSQGHPSPGSQVPKTGTLHHSSPRVTGMGRHRTLHLCLMQTCGSWTTHAGAALPKKRRQQQLCLLFLYILITPAFGSSYVFSHVFRRKTRNTNTLSNWHLVEICVKMKERGRVVKK